GYLHLDPSAGQRLAQVQHRCLGVHPVVCRQEERQVRVGLGRRTIHVSGQVSVDECGQLVGKGDLKAQTEQTFTNLKAALKAAGASFRDVVKMNLYVVGLKPELVPLIREVRARHVNRESPPASTLVGVSALVGADWLIEIEAVAVITD